ncbi:MAG: magnetosome biogenesis CDF transporter MamB [Zetaproteobacteria bacterium]|nr:magnetosome biogenesis CDF transporter MamB [Zetaproteobacteria bacterium]
MARKVSKQKTDRCKGCREEVIWWAFFVNIGQTLFKGALGFISGSAALVADAMHSGADVAASAVTMTSVKISNRPANEKYPYGYGNIQFISSSVVGLILLFGAIYLMYESTLKIITGDTSSPSVVAILGAIMSIVTNEIMYRYQHCVGNKNNSPAILANALDNRSDAMSSAAVLIGIVIAVLGFPMADSLAAIMVGIMVAKIGIELNVDALSGLMDASVEMDILSAAFKEAKDVPGVESIHYIRGRNVGEDVFLDLSICVDPDISIVEADRVAERVKETILSHHELDHLKELKVSVVPISEEERAEKAGWFATTVAS